MLPLSSIDDVQFAEPTPAQPELSDVFNASFELAQQDTVVTSIARNYALDELESRGGKVLTPEEANLKYKNVPVPFDKPVNELVAFHLDDEASQRNELSRRIEEGPTGSGITNFVASSIAHLFDPVETLAGIVTGGALSVGGRLAAKSAIPAVANIGSKLAAPSGLAATFGREATENFVGGMIAESYVVGSSKRAQQDYGWQDAFVNSFGSALLGGTVSTGAKFAISRFGAKSSLSGMAAKSDKGTELAIQGTIRQLESDRIPTPDVVEQVFVKQAYGEPNPKAAMGEVRASYVHKPLNVDAIGEVPLFTPTKMTNSLDAGSRSFGQEFGDGLTLTDNPHVANNVSGHALEEMPTSVAQIKLENARILDLDRPLLEIPELKDVVTEARTVRQYLDAVRSKIDSGETSDADFEAVNQAVKNAGYDGYKLEVTDQAQPFHQIHIFPESVAKVKAEGFAKTDLDALPELDRTALQRAQDSLMEKDGDLFTDTEMRAELMKQEPVVIKTPENVKKELEESMQTLERMEKNGFLTDEQMASLAETKQTMEFINSREQVANDFVNCLFGGV